MQILRPHPELLNQTHERWGEMTVMYTKVENTVLDHRNWFCNKCHFYSQNNRTMKLEKGSVCWRMNSVLRPDTHPDTVHAPGGKHRPVPSSWPALPYFSSPPQPKSASVVASGTPTETSLRQTSLAWGGGEGFLFKNIFYCKRNVCWQQLIIFKFMASSLNCIWTAQARTWELSLRGRDSFSEFKKNS